MSLVNTTPVDARPAMPVELAYRVMGVRLDEAWSGWVADDLEQPGWRWRHLRLTAPALVVVVSVLALMWFRLTDLAFPYAGLGGFAGALLGPLVLPDLAKRRIMRVQRGQSWISLPGLTFRELLLFTAAGYELVFGATAALLIVLR